jgi:hypothetical protein
MPPSTWRWSRHGLPRRLSAGSNRCTRLKAESVSSNIALLLGSWTIQERDAIGHHRHQQQSAAAVLIRRAAIAEANERPSANAWPLISLEVSIRLACSHRVTVVPAALMGGGGR